MALFSSERRWQPSFFPFQRPPLGMRLLVRAERMVKGPLFGCRMCGNCLLQETAFICHMQCPKGLRNGPCGGSTPEKCYVDESRKCIWYDVLKRAKKTGREQRLLEVLPPIDWDKAGGETWADVVRSVRKTGTGKFLGGFFSGNKSRRTEVWEEVFKPVRQPGWWNGDDVYHPPAYAEPISNLERRLRSGEFVVTTEVTPPIGAGSAKLLESIKFIEPFVTAMNFTDNSSASPRMSSVACSQIAVSMGAEPVLQVAAREKTRSSLQSEIIGASAMGIRNLLCVSGDSARIGPTPRSNMQVLDVDAVQMLWILRKMRDEGTYLDGRKIKTPPKLFLGAATSPFAAEPELQIYREIKKVNAGAQFFQTNLIFDHQKLELWLEQLYKHGLFEKVFVLVGITPLKSLAMARHLHENIPGVNIPERILKRIEKAGPSASEEGIAISLELMSTIRQKQGVSGFHLMTFGSEEITKRLILEAGLPLPA